MKKNVIGRILNGLLTIGVVAAVGFGFVGLMALIFADGQSLIMRIGYGLVAVFAFLIGFLDEKEAE